VRIEGNAIELGGARLILVSDGTCWMDGGAVFGLVPKTLWQEVHPPDEANRVPVEMTCLVIESCGKRILVDVGMGDKLPPRWREIYGLPAGDGRLARSLARVGLEVEDIDIVIPTHLHLDHGGGLTAYRNGEVVPTFPRAEYWIQRKEWQTALRPNERTRATYLVDNLLPLAGQLRLLSGEARPTPEVRCTVTPGHTPGHQSVLIESGGEGALFLGDAAPYVVTLERLAWISAADVEPLVSLETKRKVVRWAREEGLLLIFPHDPHVAAGRVRGERNKHWVDPLAEAPGW
jgi:glyoxylase-like metal-dependent hydrolase (beta-lactamase superfamily II)